MSQFQKGKLLKRYKRFFADIEFNSEVITAHLPNTGSLKTVSLEDTDCLFTTSDDPKRKLKYTLEMIQTPEGWAGVNTRVPNMSVKESLSKNKLGQAFTHFQSEVKISDKTRIDFALYNGEITKLKFPNYFENFDKKDLHFIEVKNVTMKKGSTALFPDGVTTRGTKHLLELIELKQKGYSTEIIFTIQRENCDSFSIAKDIDLEYFKAFKSAMEEGVKVSAYELLLFNESYILNTEKKINIDI